MLMQSYFTSVYAYLTCKMSNILILDALHRSVILYELLPISAVLRHDSDTDRTTSSNHSHSEEAAKNSGGGLYSWLSSWIYGPRKGSQHFSAFS